MMTKPGFSRPSHPPNVSAVTAMAQAEDDVALMRRVVAHDQEAFNTLYARYSQRLRGYLMRFLGQPPLVDEVLNDVMLVMWQRAAHFDLTAPLVPWLIGIARQKARKALSRISSPTMTPTMHNVIDIATPEEKILCQEHGGLLARALRTLPPSQRTVLELLVYQGCSYQEIANRTGTPVNTVKTRVFRARCNLATRIATSD